MIIFNNDLPYLVEDCPGNVSNSQLLFDMADYHDFIDTTYTLNFMDNSNPLPPLSSSTTSVLIADNAGVSEFNTYEVCAGAGTVSHTNVITSIDLPTTISLLGVTDLNGNPLIFNQTASNPTFNSYLVETPDLAPNTCFEIVIETELLFCPTPELDTEICVGTTSSCLEPELASSLFGAAGGACESTSTCYKYIAEESEIQAAWIPLFEPTVPLCSTQDFQVEIKNTKLGRLIDLDFNFNLPPGLNYISGSFEYDYAGGSNNWMPLPDPTVNGTNPFGSILTIFDNSMPPILQNGLPGIDAIADSNRIYIRFKAETICDEYVSPTPLYFNATAQNACEARIQSPLTINPDLIVTNADPLDAAQFLISTEPLKYLCGESVTVAVNGINLSNTGGITTDTKACFSFPPELAYTPNSFNLTAPAGWVPTFVNETLLSNGYRQICFDLPDGMQLQEFFAFTVELTPDNSTSCGEVLFLAEVSSEIVDQFCEANNQLCTVFVNNTINDQTVLTITPPVEIANLDVEVACDEDPTISTYNYTASLEGVTTSDYIGNVTIEWFNDVDGDGVVSAFDMAKQ